MSDIVIKKLKKYVLYISTVFFVGIGIHLLYTYLYEGAMSEPIEGGTVSEAIIGGFPHFNPLIPSNDHNAYINGLLYRSMLQYSPESESFESDLVSCNLDNLLYIECILESNLKWSNGKDITTDDIKSTLDIIVQTKVNPNIAGLLKDTIIEITNDSISFKNAGKDINFLEIFLQPILPKSVVETLDRDNIDGKFSEIGGIYSGRFVLTNISQDKTVGITKLSFGKNYNYFGNEMFINLLILNLFRDEAHFLKNKNSFNIFNDSDIIIGNSIPRLNVFEYTLSQFAASFFNSETLPKDLREFLSLSIKREDIVNAIGEQRVAPAYNPFLTDISIDVSQSDFNLETYLEEKGYYSKKELLKTVLETRKQLEEKQMSAETLTRIREQERQKELESQKKQETLTYISSPSTDKYTFVSQDNILVQGSVEENVDAVFINDYKLTGFTPGDRVFYYRLLEGYDTIAPGENSYKVYFEKNRELEEKEEFFYIYNTDSEKLKEIESTYFNTSTEIGDEQQSSTGSGEVVSSSIVETTLTATEIEALENEYYYDKDGNKFEIDIIYTQTSSDIQIAAEKVSEQLQNIGIATAVSALSLGEITSGLRNDSLRYDILLIGIDLKYFKSNVYQHFHSDEIQNGYNFSNFELFGLDILLEELKSNNLSTTKREELEVKILNILKQENIVKVLYTPKTQLLVDKNIKNFSLPQYLPDIKHRYFPLIDAYLSEKRIISSDEKSFSGFLGYLVSKIF